MEMNLWIEVTRLYMLMHHERRHTEFRVCLGERRLSLNEEKDSRQTSINDFSQLHVL